MRDEQFRKTIAQRGRVDRQEGHRAERVEELPGFLRSSRWSLIRMGINAVNGAFFSSLDAVGVQK
jgi:hypothetical protein